MFASFEDIAIAAETDMVESVTVHRDGPIDRTIVIYVPSSDVFVEVHDRDETIYFNGHAATTRQNAAIVRGVDRLLGHRD